MSYITDLKNRIFSTEAENMEPLVLDVFRLQAEYNPVYAEYLNYIKIKPDEVKKVAQIPYLPIQLFKTHKVALAETKPDRIFESSGTGGTPSRHYVIDEKLYRSSILQGFKIFFGDPEQYTFLALLPSYLEKENSSLVYMANYLMDQSPSGENGFYLYEHEELAATIERLKDESETRIFLLGVSFALLDFAAKYGSPLPESAIVMETGGMKGRRKELTREELHRILKKAFSIENIHSEYGMAELLSQAYAVRDGVFRTPPWMQVHIRDAYDPLSLLPVGQTGGINIIDLANFYSCSFIATQDLGRRYEDGSFEVLGRFDEADLRGCSLLYT